MHKPTKRLCITKAPVISRGSSFLPSLFGLGHGVLLTLIMRLHRNLKPIEFVGRTERIAYPARHIDSAHIPAAAAGQLKAGDGRCSPLRGLAGRVQRRER